MRACQPTMSVTFWTTRCARWVCVVPSVLETQPSTGPTIMVLAPSLYVLPAGCMSRLMIGFCGPGVGVLVGVAVAVAVRVGVGVHVGHCVGVAVNVAVGEGVMAQHVTVGPGVR